MSNFTRLKLDIGKITDKIAVSLVIGQGGSLSPLLFNVVMNEIIRIFSSQCKGAYKTRTIEVRIICYADNATLIADNEDDLEKLLFGFHKACRQFGFKITTSKTKAVKISKESLRSKLEHQGQVIEQVVSFN